MSDTRKNHTIDIERLRNDYEADDAFLGEILDAFVNEIDKALEELDSMGLDNPHKAVRSVAHRLKGSLLALTLDDAASQMKRIEQLAGQTDIADISPDHLKKEISSLARACRESVTVQMNDLRKPK